MVNHTSIRGKLIDFARLRQANATKPALGNAQMNARGDIIGRKGIILKTQEQIEEEWARQKANQAASTPINIKKPIQINDIINNVPVLPTKNLDINDAAFEPVVEPIPTDVNTKRTRKVVDEE
jgi:hypothetical protein